jgi:hypothetical protein
LVKGIRKIFKVGFGIKGNVTQPEIKKALLESFSELLNNMEKEQVTILDLDEIKMIIEKIDIHGITPVPPYHRISMFAVPKEDETK